MSTASQVLLRASRGRASFRKVTLLVPQGCQGLGALREAAGETYADADVRVTAGPHPR